MQSLSRTKRWAAVSARPVTDEGRLEEVAEKLRKHRAHARAEKTLAGEDTFSQGPQGNYRDVSVGKRDDGRTLPV